VPKAEFRTDTPKAALPVALSDQAPAYAQRQNDPGSAQSANAILSETPMNSSSSNMHTHVNQSGQNNCSSRECDADLAERGSQISLNAGAAEFSPNMNGNHPQCQPPPTAAGLAGFYGPTPGIGAGIFPPQGLPPGSVPMDVLPFYPPMGNSPVTFYGGSYGFQV
jgi:hypothetical protein